MRLDKGCPAAYQTTYQSGYQTGTADRKGARP